MFYFLTINFIANAYSRGGLRRFTWKFRSNFSTMHFISNTERMCKRNETILGISLGRQCEDILCQRLCLLSIQRSCQIVLRTPLHDHVYVLNAGLQKRS